MPTAMLSLRLAHEARLGSRAMCNFEQKTEDLLGQQLQRWGREMLYEESMVVTAQIIKLAEQLPEN